MSDVKTALQAKLDATLAARPKMSKDDLEETELRDKIAEAERRNREEATKARKLELDRFLEKIRPDFPDDVVLEIADVEAHTKGAGSYILRSPPEDVAEQFDRAIKSNPDGATDSDTRDFVIGCIVHPDPEKHGVAIRDRFDNLHYLPRTLSDIALRLAGLVPDLRRRKS
jgi:hypothetical protein